MPNETTYSGILGELARFQASMEAKIVDIPHLQPSRARFGEALTKAQDLVRRQAAAVADKQDLSQQIKTAVSDVRRLGTVLRKGLIQHFGVKSETLAEFGLQPFRGRKLTAKLAPEPTPTPTPDPAPTTIAK